jgi:hypothetical protein
MIEPCKILDQIISSYSSMFTILESKSCESGLYFYNTYNNRLIHSLFAKHNSY